MSERWVVVDLEATCWVPGVDPALAADQRNECETIEIGAVRIDPGTWEIGEPWRSLVRPRRHPRLSAFCTGLTGISQAEVDGARPFPEAYAEFVAWAGGDDGLVLASWGSFDDRQLRRDAARFELPAPRWRGLNVKRMFARYAVRNSAGRNSAGARRNGWMGLASAVAHLGGTFTGQPHRGLDDARNVAWVLGTCARTLPRG
jgi:inhibitor of KinA sporulation pathway (predicted exonuclease)